MTLCGRIQMTIAIFLAWSVAAWTNDARADAEPEVEVGAEAETDGETEADAKAEAETDGETEADAKARGESDVETEPEAEHAGETESAEDPEVEKMYEAAFDALVHGDVEAAIAGFDQVARDARDPDVRAASRELARLGRQLAERGLPPEYERDAPGPDPRAMPDELPEDDRPDAGRIEFVAGTTTASLYAGAVLTAQLEIDSFPGAVAFITGTTGAGFAASLAGSRNLELTSGMGDAYTLGLTVGVANGLLVAWPLGLDGSEAFTFSLGTMAGGGALGYALARAADPTPGQMTVTGNLAALGTGTAGLGLAIGQPDIGSDALLLTLAGGLNVGTVAGVAMSRGLDWSPQRARLVSLSSSLGGLVGGAAGAIVGSSVEDDDNALRIASATILTGLWTGFGLGAHFTRNMDPAERFLPEYAASLSLAPLAVDGGGGLALGGEF